MRFMYAGALTFVTLSKTGIQLRSMSAEATLSKPAQSALKWLTIHAVRSTNQTLISMRPINRADAAPERD